MGRQTRPGNHTGGGFAISVGGEPMGTMPFAQLGRGLYRPEDCITTRRFLEDPH